MKQMKLQTKLIISYFLLSLFIIGSLFLVSNYMIEKQFHEYVMERREASNLELLEDIQEVLGKPEPVIADFRPIADRAIRQNIFFKLEDMQGRDMLRLLRQNTGAPGSGMGMGMSMRRSHHDDPPKPPERPSWLRGQNAENRIMEKTYPIMVNGKQIGQATFSCPFEFTNSDSYFVEMLNNFLGKAALVFLLIAIGCGYYMSGKIAKPLRKVITQTREIEKGDYDTKLDVRSNTTEISELINSVNTLGQTLKAQQQYQKRLARDYAHEIRTPLAAIQSNLEGMIDGVLDTTNERLESCRAEILRLGRMIAQIDKIVEINENKIILHKVNFDLRELIVQSSKAFDKQLMDKQIRMELELPELLVHADKDRIGQVFVNLFSNAIKYTDSGGMITVSGSQTADKVRVTMRDTGAGISSEALPHIFEHMYRADQSRNRDTGGSGIGLAIVKGIVDKHGGSVQVESEPGVGSSFTVILPGTIPKN